jgi:hypothetical protein
MSAATLHFAPVMVLFFLGTILLLGAGVLILLYGTIRRSSLIASASGIGIAAIVAGYFLLLLAFSLSSSETILPAGGWKYFCEIDCHIAYSLTGVETAAALGPELQQVSAHGEFVVVRVKSWFDEHSISPHRGNGPLTPNARRVVLVDTTGESYAPAGNAEATLAGLGAKSTPLTQALRPGKSYTTDFVFDVPPHSHGLRLLVTEDIPETRFILGHENSLLHKKIYFAVDGAPLLAKVAQ